MREIKVKSTKAAYDRLFLMRDPGALSLPFDTARIAPFGVRVTDRDNRRHFEVLFRDQVIGVALLHRGDGFRVRLSVPPSEPFDAAVQRVFGILRTHLDQVGRVMAAETRERKASSEYLDAQARKAKEEADAARQQAEREARHAEEMRQRRKASFDGMIIEGPVPELIVLPGITEEIIEMASKHEAKEDRIRVRRRERPHSVRIMTPNGGTWTFESRNDTYVLDTTDLTIQKLGRSEAFHAPDAAKVAAEVIKVAERNARANDAAMIREALSRLPEPKYALSRLRLCPPETYIRGQTDLCDLGDGVQIRANYSSISLACEGVLVARWSVHLNSSDERTVVRPSCEIESLTEQDLLVPSVVERLVSLWAERLFPICDIPLEPYAVFDMEAAEAEVASLDFGYDF